MYQYPSLNSLSAEEIDYWATWQMTEERPEMETILKGHLLIETILEQLILPKLVNPDSLLKKNRSFDLKLDIAHALGVLPDRHREVAKALNGLRNNFAHRLNDGFNLEELNSLKGIWNGAHRADFEEVRTKNPKQTTHTAIVITVATFLGLLASDRSPPAED
ncbi:MAG: hypothetical protein I8H67_10985 [Comamonadaceae bacterium]|nr:hypothetical protein [Comamonadaceae bacterium]